MAILDIANTPIYLLILFIWIFYIANRLGNMRKKTAELELRLMELEKFQ